jgi:hypothetical protein
MACQQRAALQEKYEEDVAAYTASVSKMRDLIQAIPHVEFMILWKTAEVCRQSCELAQRNLQEHVIEHHCF